MLVWLNGTFGVGKTTTATEIVGRCPELRLFDPEQVGYMLRANLGDVKFDDFQDLPPWRSLVPRVASEIAELTGHDLLAVQTVLVEPYWKELHSGLTDHGIDVTHVVLDCDEEALRKRITSDEFIPSVTGWRLDHIGRYRSARTWMLEQADLVVDVTHRSPQETADAILSTLAST